MLFSHLFFKRGAAAPRGGVRKNRSMPAATWSWPPAALKWWWPGHSEPPARQRHQPALDAAERYGGGSTSRRTAPLQIAYDHLPSSRLAPRSLALDAQPLPSPPDFPGWSRARALPSSRTLARCRSPCATHECLGVPGPRSPSAGLSCRGLGRHANLTFSSFRRRRLSGSHSGSTAVYRSPSFLSPPSSMEQAVAIHEPVHVFPAAPTAASLRLAASVQQPFLR